MGGNIQVGNLRRRPTPAELDANVWCGWTVDTPEVCPLDAPAFPVVALSPLRFDRGADPVRPPGHWGQSYGSWKSFQDVTGLGEVFGPARMGRTDFGVSYVRLTERRVARITELLDAYRLRHPDAVPCFYAGIGATPNDAHIRDAFLARLVWVEWWCRWAHSNCPAPAIGFF